MQDASHAGPGRATAVVLVRNAVDHDSRVLREARTLEALGLDTVVLGVVSFTQDREVTEHDGVTVRRIGPRSRLGWAILREISNLRPVRSEAVAAPPSRSPAATGVRSAARRLLRWLSTLAYYTRAIAEVRRLGPDLVHCNDYNTMWVGVAAKLMHRSALVYDSHELWADRSQRAEPRPWLVACEALFVRVADRVVTTSPAYAEELARRYRVRPPTVVRNIPDREREARPAPASGDGRADGPLAIYVGGLQPGRGLEGSIRALAAAPEVRLRLLGPGSPAYRAGLERLAGEVGVDDRVEFAEPVPPERLLDAIHGADVGLALIEPTCLSYRLTLPNKLFEYALAGVPILASDLPMISRFVAEHGLGVTVDPEEPEAIASGLAAMVDGERAASYRRAAERAAGVLDSKQEQEVLAAVYRDALGWR